MRAVRTLFAFGAKLVADLQVVEGTLLRIAELNGVGRVAAHLHFVRDGDDDGLRPGGSARRDGDLFRLRVERGDDAGESALSPLCAIFILLLRNVGLTD